MAFCTNCGKQTDGGFCGNCGARIDAPGAAAPPPAPPAPAPAYAAPAGGKKKTSPFVWIAAVLIGLFLLIGIGVIGAFYFVAHKVKNAGLDSELMQKNPALAAAKMMVALNPEVEVVNVDEDKGILSIREKKTGKVITMNAEDIKNGKISFSDESTGETVSFGADASAKLPAWVPDYPGSKPEGAFSASGKDGDGGMAHFKTNDAAPKVLAFYQDALKRAGYKITASLSGAADASGGGMVAGEDAANKRSVMVTVSAGGEGTDVALTYGTKK
jgi:hypothetical protein